ncbi:MAG: hypothetical protein K8R23_17960 [Chthoniobacter sp.]|nr:hypothetical protein [Chthoniobacter sp.]
MQIFSLGAMAVEAASQPDFQPVLARLGEFMQRDEVRWLRNFFLAMFIATQLLNILWCWIASKIAVRGEHATLGNACKVWLVSLLLPLAIGAGLFFFGPMVIGSLDGISPASALALFGCFFFLCLLLFLFIPMQVYEIGFLNALGFVVLTVIFTAVGNSAAQVVVGNLFHMKGRIEALKNSTGKTDAERQAFTDRLFGKDAPDEIDRMLDDAAQPIGRAKTLTEREATIQSIQQKLEARHRALPPGNPQALTTFQVQFDRYMHLLNQAKTDRAAPLTPPKKS